MSDQLARDDAQKNQSTTFQQPLARRIHEELRKDEEEAGASRVHHGGALPYTCAMPLDADMIDKLARLAALRLTAHEQARARIDLERIIGLIDAMQAVDTDAVDPLAHPLDGVQPLRADQVTETVEPSRYQAVAPQVRDGLYLVPRVVE